MSDRLHALQVFGRVARLGSFSAAAREFKLTQSAVSRIVARLEREVGVALLARNTRSVVLTDAGASYLAGIEPALETLADAERSARGSGALRGRLHVAMTSSIAIREVIPRLAAFTARHPDLRLVLSIADERRSLVHEGVDVALRLGPLDDSSMVARSIGSFPFAFYASPDYLDAHGHPAKPTDLARLSAIHHAEKPTARWTFTRKRAVQVLDLPARHVVSSQEACVAAAKAGLGYIYSAALAVRQELADGRLVRVLPEWDVGTLQVNLLFPSGRAASPAARAFGEFLQGLAEAGVLDDALPGPGRSDAAT